MYLLVHLPTQQDTHALGFCKSAWSSLPRREGLDSCDNSALASSPFWAFNSSRAFAIAPGPLGDPLSSHPLALKQVALNEEIQD